MYVFTVLTPENNSLAILWLLNPRPMSVRVSTSRGERPWGDTSGESFRAVTRQRVVGQRPRIGRIELPRDAFDVFLSHTFDAIAEHASRPCAIGSHVLRCNTVRAGQV